MLVPLVYKKLEYKMLIILKIAFFLVAKKPPKGENNSRKLKVVQTHSQVVNNGKKKNVMMRDVDGINPHRSLTFVHLPT